MNNGNLTNAEKADLLKYSVRDLISNVKLPRLSNAELSETISIERSKNVYNYIIKSITLKGSSYLDKSKLQIISSGEHFFIRYLDTYLRKTLYIDPNIQKYAPSFDGIFVGYEDDLQKETNEINLDNLFVETELMNQRDSLLRRMPRYNFVNSRKSKSRKSKSRSV